MEGADPVSDGIRAPASGAGAGESHPSWREVLTDEEVAALLAKSDARGLLTLLGNWALIAVGFALVALWPNPMTIVASIVLIGSRQLGLAVIMHDASHRSLFASPWLNDTLGQWLGAYPIWNDCALYRPYHLKHHAHTGSERDPDLGLVKPFPITRASLRRKIGRDLSGRTGSKFARAAWKRTFGRWAEDETARRAAIGVVVTNLALFGVLALSGHPALYLLWIAAWLTTQTLVTRIRSIAEHALTPDPRDPLRNTRTTLARWWERLLLAPIHVNYHLEHHLMMTVPHQNLPKLHVLLRQRGVLDRACVEERGYLEILRNAASRPA